MLVCCELPIISGTESNATYIERMRMRMKLLKGKTNEELYDRIYGPELRDASWMLGVLKCYFDESSTYVALTF